jgi:hypothetical protein
MIKFKELHANSIRRDYLSRNHERLDEVESYALKAAERAHLTGVDARLVVWRDASAQTPHE